MIERAYVCLRCRLPWLTFTQPHTPADRCCPFCGTQRVLSWRRQ